MAKFRDSSIVDVLNKRESAAEPSTASDGVMDRSIGSIIAETRNLSADQVEQILVLQRERGIRFGEAAIALGYASTDDVLFALSQQFHYPYAAEEDRSLSPELVALNSPFSEQAEVFRKIRSQVLMRAFPEQGEPRRALAIVSADPKDGKTFFAANLAVTLAQLGGRTLLIDADMRSPRVDQIFRLSNDSGLSGILSGRAQAQVLQQVRGIPSLFVLPVGVIPPNPLELIERPAFPLLMRELNAKFDHVVVDTPALKHGADALSIAARCGAALVLARKNTSRVKMMSELLTVLEQNSTRLVGVLLNDH